MPIDLTLSDVILRLVCTLIAGAVIGYNRGERGKAAGLRTTLLVCLAASVAMLQVNYLLPLAGRSPDSFVMNDLMRLPLGILTGVGFIGGGAILRRGDMVTGVTTAATLWYVTVVGLCFGGGQMLLGWLATAIGALVLWLVKWLEATMTADFRARLVVTVEAAGPAARDIRGHLEASALTVKTIAVDMESEHRMYIYEVAQRRLPSEAAVPAVVDMLASQSGVRRVSWRPIG
jgi:putative Mg2+ transporter-C (MgtC) family protein